MVVLQFVATNGTAPYTYSWDSGSSSASATNLDAGTHIVTVTDANNCTTTASAMITEPSSLGVSVNFNSNVTCSGLSDGVATATATGGTAPYIYSWDSGSTSPTATNLNTGTHIVTVTDANNCTSTASVTISAPSVLSSIVTVLNHVSCNGLSNGSATVSTIGGTAPYTYQWSSGTTNMTANNLSAGGYFVTVTDSNGCTSIGSVTINEPSSLTLSVNVNNNAGCNGSSDGSATATGAGGTSPYTYLWDSGQSGPTVNNLSVGLHYVTITDSNGCVANAFVSITEPSSLSVTVNSSNVSCNGLSDGEATLSAAGGTAPYNYIWSTGQTGNLLLNAHAGTYSYTVTDNNSCITVGSLVISEPSPLAITVNPGDVSCFGGNDGQAIGLPLGGTAPYSYNWSNGETTPTAISFSAGYHTLVVTDANGCTVSNSFFIGTPPALQLVSILENPVTCFGGNDGTATLTITGGTPSYTYNWSDGQVTNPAIGLAAGNYTVTVTDVNNCSLSINVTINEPSLAIDPMITSTNASCFGAADGTATVAPVGGTPGYTYLWNNGATTSGITGLINGSYTITITDQNGCLAIATTVVSSPTLLAGQTQITDATCDDFADGIIEVIPTGGTAPYVYSLNGGTYSVDSVFFGLSAGNYTITIQDAVGCEFEFSNIIVDDNPPILIDIAQAPEITISLGDSVQLMPVITPVLPYDYSWSPGNWLSCSDCLSPWAAPHETITYTLEVTDTLDGCTAEASVLVIVDDTQNVYSPNAFTPNGDGVNDRFTIFGGPDVSNIKVLRVYNRWGELLFQGENLPPNDANSGWDGSFRGKTINSGVFVYYAEVEFINGKVILYKGDVTMHR